MLAHVAPPHKLWLHFMHCLSKVASPHVSTVGLEMQGNAYDDDEEYGDVDDGGDEGALY